MPTIVATPDPLTGHVLVQVDWGDVNGVSCTQVYRTNANGFVSNLRPYVLPCTDLGEWQRLSNRVALFWDNEAPLDSAYSYTAVGADGNGDAVAVINAYTLSDVFNRTTSNGWGVAPTGQTWVVAASPASSYATTTASGGFASILCDTSGSYREIVAPVGYTNGDGYADIVFTALAATSFVYAGVLVRSDSNADNTLMVLLRLSPNGDLYTTFRNTQLINGVLVTTETEVAGVWFTIVTTGERWRLRVSVVGHLVRMKLWSPDRASDEPVNWMDEQDLDGLLLNGGLGSQPAGTGGYVGAVARNDGTGTPTVRFTKFVWRPVDGNGDPLATVQSGLLTPITLASDAGDGFGGRFWLRDPQRPANDRGVFICWPQGARYCNPTAATFLVGMDQETYAAQSGEQVVADAHRPLAWGRQRLDASSSLAVTPRTFADRDGLLTTLQPGDPLQFVAPPQYGMPDRYMDVRDAAVQRLYEDHRKTPRTISMPFVTVDRPVALTQGMAGNRVSDLCDVYATWQAMTTAGLSYEDLLLGKAGAETDAPSLMKTYTQVAASYATYTLMAAKTFDQIRLGL